MSKPGLKKHHLGCQHQGGAVLLLSLIVLVALMMLSVGSMDTAIMEIQMAGTLQQQMVAMNRAETALRSAETRIDTITSDGTVWNFEATTDGLYPADNALNLEQTDWSSISAEDGPVTSDNHVDDNDLYVIEYLGVKPVPGETVVLDPDGGIAGGAVHTFRSTTRIASGRNVVRIVQSIYVTFSSP